jgi:paraquat-inducible protein B
MSKPANKKVIGIFVLGAIALLIGALVVFGSGKIFKKTVPVVFYFGGSVKGLNIGSAVMIRGVQVGSVTNVILQFNPKDLSLRIPVYADFDPEKVARISGKIYEGEERAKMYKMMIDHGLRAQLEMQSVLTGLLMVNLDFLPNTPATLVGTDPKQFEIPTVPTPLEALTEKLQKLPIEETFTKLANAVSGIEKVANNPELEKGIKNLSQSVEEMQKLIKSISAEIKPLSAGVQETLKDARTFIKKADGQIEGLMGDAQKLVQNVDRHVGPLAVRVEDTLDGVQKLVGEVKGEVGPLSSDLKKTLEDMRLALTQVQKTLQAAEGSYTEGTAFHSELTETLGGLNETSRSIQQLVEYLQRHPDSVLWGKGKPGGK